jgi:hypothetical protein
MGSSSIYDGAMFVSFDNQVCLEKIKKSEIKD